MISDREIAEIVAKCTSAPFEGVVYRHMFANYPPDRENRRGARWNPPDTPAIYCSLSRAVALAEAEYRISLETIRPKAKRTIYKIAIRLNDVLTLTAESSLDALGIPEAELKKADYAMCQRVGGIVAQQGHDGLLVPSARATGTNLTIFPNRQKENFRFEIVDSEIIDIGKL